MKRAKVLLVMLAVLLSGQVSWAGQPPDKLPVGPGAIRPGTLKSENLPLPKAEMIPPPKPEEPVPLPSLQAVPAAAVGPCSADHPGTSLRGKLRRFVQWATYRPAYRACPACNGGPRPCCRPPLYAYFLDGCAPCAGHGYGPPAGTMPPPPASPLPSPQGGPQPLTMPPPPPEPDLMPSANDRPKGK